MPAVKQKDGTWRVKKKDGTLGKRRFSTQANALAAQRRAPGKKKAKKRSVAKRPAAKKPARKRSRSVAKKGNPNNRSPKIGAAIQGFKATQPLLSPVIEAGRQGFTQAAVDNLRTKANISYAGNVAATAVNRKIDKKLAHGGALSRGSITAWAPEVYAGLRVADQVKGVSGRTAILRANSQLARMLNGYNPEAGVMDLANSDFRTYHGLKIGGGIFRRASNTGPLKGVFEPVKKFLGDMGVAL